MEYRSDSDNKKIDLLSLDMDMLKNLQKLSNSDTTENFKSINQKIVSVEGYLNGISRFSIINYDNYQQLPKTNLFIFREKLKPKQPEVIPVQQTSSANNEIKESEGKKEKKIKEKEEAKSFYEKELKEEKKKTEEEKTNFKLGTNLFQDTISGQAPKNFKNMFDKTDTPTIQEEKNELNKLSFSTNLFGLNDKLVQEPLKPKAESIKPVASISTSQIIKAAPIESKTEPIKPLIQQKEEPKQPERQEAKAESSFPFRQKLIKAADNYWNLRDILKTLQTTSNKKATDKICFETNTVIDQISLEEHLEERIKTLNTILKEIVNMKDNQLYVYALNYICQRIILKADKYRKEHKKIFLTFAKFIYKLSQEHKLLQDYFIMMIVYKCPYVIPIVYNKKSFKDNYTYMKRLGYSTEKETINDMINNMECYGYFYFAFLSCDSKYIPVIKEYIDSLETIVIDYPITTVFKTFLNTLGNLVKNKIPNASQQLKKISEKFIKGLTELKTNSKISLLKSIAGENIHFIKLYLKDILNDAKTDMYVDQK